ncbi:MAG: aldo/keto reductase [Undibacterium umbellatum]|uniref:aldo/keto reductase n=1 Tax=Undibacterium umbellatum TaxID=2762300 RepID=UPI003BB66A46
MKQRKIGNSGMATSAMGLGCMGMSEFYGNADDAGSLATLEAAFEAGVTLFDTADAYGMGKNEELLGRFIKGKNDKLRIASKFGLIRKEGSYERRVDNSPAYIRTAVEASLRRLGIEAIDLYYIHRLNLDTPLEVSIGTLSDLVAEGKIRAIGLCEVSPETLRQASTIHPVAAVQSEYSLWTRDPEAGVLQACREVGASFIAYSPLGRGFLTGAIQDRTSLSEGDFRSFNPRFSDENLVRNLAIVEVIKQFSLDMGCTPAQLALAWLLAQGEDIIPIPGTKRISYLHENLTAIQISLSKSDLDKISQALPAGMAAGERYTEEGMKGMHA